MENQPVEKPSEPKNLLEENLERSEKILAEVYKIKKYIRRQLIWSIATSALTALFFLTPVILAFMYLPPYLKPLIEQYRQIFNTKF